MSTAKRPAAGGGATAALTPSVSRVRQAPAADDRRKTSDVDVLSYDWAPGLNIHSCLAANGREDQLTVHSGFKGKPLRGRAFRKEKTGMTKGEEKIISGIIENRGDLEATVAVPTVKHGGDRTMAVPATSADRLMTHKDAWRVQGAVYKSLVRKKMLGRYLLACQSFEHLSLRRSQPKCACHSKQTKPNDSNATTAFCQKCTEEWMVENMFGVDENRRHWRAAGDSSSVGADGNSDTYKSTASHHNTAAKTKKHLNVYLPSLSSASPSSSSPAAADNSSQHALLRAGGGAEYVLSPGTPALSMASSPRHGSPAGPGPGHVHHGSSHGHMVRPDVDVSTLCLFGTPLASSS